MTQEQTPKLPVCVLPHEEVRTFLLTTIANASFQGKEARFVSQVQRLLQEATIQE